MLAYNSKLIFSSELDEKRILDFLEKENQVWNSCSKMVYENKLELNLKVVHHFCYYRLKKEFPDIPVQMIVRSQKSVLASFRSIKENEHRVEEAPTRKNLSVRLDKRLCNLNLDFSLRLTTLEKSKRISVNFIKYPKLMEMFSKYKVSDPSLFMKGNQIYISFSFDVPTADVEKTSAVGIDLGMRNLAVTSEGFVYVDKEYLKRKRQTRFLKRKLYSKGTKSARKHARKISRTESNSTKNMVHNLSKQILKDATANLIVMEDLTELKENTKRGKRWNNKHSQIPYYLIKNILTYKALLYNKKVETVSPHYTSQIDFRTKLLDGKRQKGRYVGKDGKILHSDFNATFNIAERNENKLPISYKNFSIIFGQGLVKVPIVFKSNYSSSLYKPPALAGGV